jgi:hypothetical protein
VRNSVLVWPDTPLETHRIGEYLVHVKREDLASPYPGPSFSKIRGVVSHIRKRPQNVIGVLDTYHSKAGWAVSFVCNHLGKRCVNFYPRYKRDGYELRPQQQEAEKNGARLVPLQATASWALYHQARTAIGADGYMMPNALKLEESVSETEAEALRTPGIEFVRTTIIPISSGTIAAGVIRALLSVGGFSQIILHLGYSRSADAVRAYINEKAPGASALDIRIIDERYQYKDKSRADPKLSFPANPYYDMKAAAWLARLPAGELAEPVLFWNIGA